MDYMRTLTNFYLGNLAVADLSFIAVTAVRYFWSYTRSPVQAEVPYRSTFITYLCVFSCLSFFTLVTVERYFAICKQFSKNSGKNRSIKLVGL